jgi:sortase A
MATQPRPTHAPNNQEHLDLLQALLDVPAAQPGARLQPIALRSTAEQRRHALRSYRLRTWFDTLLHHAERMLLLATLAFFGYWFIDGPLRDWMHDVQQPPRAAPTSGTAAHSAGGLQLAAPVARPGRAIRLPSVRPGADRAVSQREPSTGQPRVVDEIQQDFFAPRGRPPAAPLVVVSQPTHLVIPAIALDTPVKEVFVVDGEWEVAEYAAGFLHATAFPGEGNTVLAGHAGIRGAVFRDLGSLNPGDDIFVDAGDWRYRYRVRESKNVWPDQVEILDPTPNPILTLLTCTNWDTQRLVVVADLVESKPFTGG